MVAEVFVTTIVKLHGMPRSIICDCDLVSISHFCQEVFKLSGTTLKMSSFYHPQTDDQSEVTNRTLEQYLRCLCHQQPHSWSTLLHWVEYWYNTSYHSSIKMTRFQALYGWPPPTIPFIHTGTSAVNEVDIQLTKRGELLQHLKSNLPA